MDIYNYKFLYPELNENKYLVLEYINNYTDRILKSFQKFGIFRVRCKTDNCDTNYISINNEYLINVYLSYLFSNPTCSVCKYKFSKKYKNLVKKPIFNKITDILRILLYLKKLKCSEKFPNIINDFNISNKLDLFSFKYNDKLYAFDLFNYSIGDYFFNNREFDQITTFLENLIIHYILNYLLTINFYKVKLRVSKDRGCNTYCNIIYI